MTITEKIGDIASEIYEKVVWEEVKSMPVPNHVAIITDGNRRYASLTGISANEGHLKGKEKLEDVLDWCREIGIKVVTVYGFSTENFRRNPEEVQFLFDLLTDSLNELVDDKRVTENRIRVKVLGRIDSLPPDLRKAIALAEDRTKEYNDFRLNLAIGYGGRTEILDAVKQISEDVKAGKMESADISEATFRKYLYDGTIPDPDLVLRTSGEERVSNFLLWQSAYSELYFSEVNWPDLKKIDFLKAIHSYQTRKRRFGS
ncbi:MAG: polyprenyl diphosphate synthase [Candidatus Thermoplasmatota archaeon]|nr:polyprenyl diphosphate synthase [Candidatus Thermoplasmatota archaeon]MCL5785890.1 polyprenyl diphosphate synthase [Candidatus Thermoplasmatota archaeon]